MPSFARLHYSRSYSFPPFIDSVDFTPSSAHSTDLSDIDEDPFSHFLTPVTEEDDPFDNLTLSAGITIPDGPRTSKSSKFKSTVADKWTRYVKHNQPQLHQRYHTYSTADEEDSFMQLDDDRLLDAPQKRSQLSGPPPPRIVITEPARGRPQDFVPRKPSRRRYSRTLSGHRHSWREPSPDLFTVDESEEDDGLSLRRVKTNKKKTKDGGERRRSKDGSEKSRL